MFCLCIFWLKALGICLLGWKWKRSHLFVRILTFSMADMAMPQIVTWLQTPLAANTASCRLPRSLAYSWHYGPRACNMEVRTCLHAKPGQLCSFSACLMPPTASGAVPLSISEFFWGSLGAPVVLGVLFGRPMRAHGDSFVPRS